MAASINEGYESRKRSHTADDGAVELIYIISGTDPSGDDDAEAHLLLDDTAPDTYAGLILQETGVERIGWDTWKGTATYGIAERREAGHEDFRFDTGGGTSHITQSLGTRAAYSSRDVAAQVITITPSDIEVGDIFKIKCGSTIVSFTATSTGANNVCDGLVGNWNGSALASTITAAFFTTYLTLTANTPGAPFSVRTSTVNGGAENNQKLIATVTTPNGGAPNHNGAIGVTKDSIEGCDVLERAMKFSITKQFDDADITDDFLSKLFLYTTAVNSAPITINIRGKVMPFAVGELQFLSASGGVKGDEKWEITFNFDGVPNVEDQTIGDITGVDKMGHDYIWVQYKEAPDDGALTMVKKPLAAYVEQVYIEADLNELGVGV